MDRKEDQVAVDTNDPGTTPLTRVVRKIFNAFKRGPIDHTVSDKSMVDDYVSSPLGIPIPFRKARNKEEPQEKGSHTMKRMLKE